MLAMMRTSQPHSLPTTHPVYVRISVCCEPVGGARACMMAAASRRWTYPRIFTISSGSSVQAITRNLPPQSGQVSISMVNTRLRRCIHWTGCPGAVEHRDVRERPTHGGNGLVAVYGTAMSARYDFSRIVRCVEKPLCLTCPGPKFMPSHHH